MRLAAVLGVLVGLTGGPAGAETWKGYEMPPYRVEAVEGARELRHYGPHRLAEVGVAGDRSGAASEGFRILAGYIFGRNAAGAKIAMTVPVAMAPQGAQAGRRWTMTFMMPAAAAAGGLPAPADPRIRLVEDPGGRQAVERFSGIPREADLWARAEALRVWAEARGETVSDGPRFYFYDGPMTLPWTRRNEVAVTLR